MEAEDFDRLVMTAILHRRAVSVYEYTEALSMAIKPHDPLKIKWLISCKDSKLDSFVYLGHSNSTKQLIRMVSYRSLEDHPLLLPFL